MPDGKTVERAREIAAYMLTKPEVTLRGTRVLFIQPLKIALVQQAGYGQSLEGASASAMAKAAKAKS